MKLGIVGAGLIVNTMLEFIHEVDVELVAIAATPAEKEKLDQLQKIHGFKYIYTDFEEMLKNDEVEIVYMGVNNFLHYTFGKKVLEAGKHLIMEKPFTSNYNQAKVLIDMANEKHLMIFEAISTIYNPNFVKMRELLPTVGDVKIVSTNYTQYSSRYDAFKRGEILPAFDYKKSGGALMDLNVYNVHFITELFGAPNSVDYIANIEHNVDTSGILTLGYDKFQAVSVAAKDCGAPFVNCIQGNEGCLYTSSPLFTFTHFDHRLNKQEPVHYDYTGTAHRMKHEFERFIEVFNNKDWAANDHMKEHSLIVMDVLTKAREKIGLVFPDDENL